MAESKTAAVNYNNLIVSLAQINRRYSDIMNLLPVDGDAVVVALRAIIEFFGNLWYTPNPQWRAVRERMFIGLIKDTKNFGNTSVSQGCAVKFFREHPDKNMVVFMNCGTGGIKYQTYERKPNGVITVKGEYKPNDGASPQEFLKKHDDEFSRKAWVSWHKETLKNELKVAEIPAGCHIQAFITGKIRAAWEAGDEGTKGKLNAIMTDFFAADQRIEVAFESVSSDSFFLSQEDEGSLESDGVNSMYENLIKAGELPAEVRVMGVAGIGRGSVQITWQSVDRSHQYQMNTTPGMDDELGLRTLPWRLLGEACDKIGMIANFMGDCPAPVFALKSGCMLYLNSAAGKPLLDLLTENAESELMMSIAASKPNPETGSASNQDDDTVMLHQ